MRNITTVALALVGLISFSVPALSQTQDEHDSIEAVKSRINHAREIYVLSGNSEGVTAADQALSAVDRAGDLRRAERIEKIFNLGLSPADRAVLSGSDEVSDADDAPPEDVSQPNVPEQAVAPDAPVHEVYDARDPGQSETEADVPEEPGSPEQTVSEPRAPEAEVAEPETHEVPEPETHEHEVPDHDPPDHDSSGPD